MCGHIFTSPHMVFALWAYILGVSGCSCCAMSHSCVQLFVTLWTATCQAPLSLGFSRQEYWSGLLFSSPGDLPDPGTEPRSPALHMDSLLSEPPGKPKNTGVDGLSLLQQSSQPRNRTGVSCVKVDSLSAVCLISSYTSTTQHLP